MVLRDTLEISEIKCETLKPDRKYQRIDHVQVHLIHTPWYKLHLLLELCWWITSVDEGKIKPNLSTSKAKIDETLHDHLLSLARRECSWDARNNTQWSKLYQFKLLQESKVDPEIKAGVKTGGLIGDKSPQRDPGQSPGGCLVVYESLSR